MPRPPTLWIYIPQFYWNNVSPHIQPAIRYLNVTSSGRRWIANLDSNVFRAERQHRSDLGCCQSGEVFGELAVLDGKERSADAIAESPCTLAILDRHDILSFFERNPSAWPKLVTVLCQRLRQTDQVFAEVALLQLPARLAKSMLRLLDSHSTFAGKTPIIHYSQRELASMVGGTRESVNRCLRNWQRNGIVRITEGSIIVTNRPALEQMAEPM